MNPIELLLPGGIPSGVFACEKCRTVNNLLAVVARCCNWKCDECGKDVSRGLVKCSDCSNLAIRKRILERLATAEEVQGWDSWVYSEDFAGYNDGWFESLENFIEYVCDLDAEDREELPDFVFCSVADVRKLDFGHLVERVCEDGYEEMGESGFLLEKETQEAIERFNEANKDALTVFNIDYKRKVRVSWPQDIKSSSDLRGTAFLDVSFMPVEESSSGTK